jgi:2,3-bisphosphoglycerate-independent phosphoglycerate mutase
MNNFSQNMKKVLLLILDGFGISNKNKGDAVKLANMQTFKKLKKVYSWTKLKAFGEDVGLPEKQMGNSEVGHIHIGSGRIIDQSLNIINKSIKDKSFYQNEVILNTLKNAINNKSNLHIIGLLSDGGVHSHINHLFAILEFVKKEKKVNTFLHLIFDGRDTKPSISEKYVNELNKFIENYPHIKVISVSGRYYTMDRDKKWDRLELAYNAIVKNKSKNKFQNLNDYINNEYKENRSDEFIYPAVNKKLEKEPGISDYDSIIFYNFRSDRITQIASAISNKNYEWKGKKELKNNYVVSMMQYPNTVLVNDIVFQKKEIKNTLGSWLSKKKYHQLRIAETEKYAHVTYFFDGGKDIIYPYSKRILIPSLKVPTYDLKPEMSAFEITEAIIENIKIGKADLIVANFANPDMIGHTGNLEATKQSLKIIDKCIEKIYKCVKEANITMIITSDHGNSEVMTDENGKMNKKHTSNYVPFVINEKNLKLKKNLGLSSIAPTILKILKIKIPQEMTAQVIIEDF